MNKLRGFSLVELMVAMALSLVLMAGVLSIFFSTKVTYFHNERTSRLQENGRVALDMIVNDIRASGYPGCAKPLSGVMEYYTTLNNSSNVLWDFSVPLQGAEYTGASSWSPAVGTVLAPVPLDGTDVIAVRVPIRGSRAMRLETTMGGATADPDVPDAAPPTAGQILMITDCNANVTSTFQMTGWAAGAVVHTATGASPGNATADLGYIFQEGARVLPVQTIIYYIANNAANQPGLWRQVGANASEEMIVGVQGLEIVYGEDTTADRVADQYVAADVISDWANVISVSVSLLVRSEEASGTETDTVTYDLLGTAAGPFNDNFQRMQFNTTAALRNRAL